MLPSYSQMFITCKIYSKAYKTSLFWWRAHLQHCNVLQAAW